MHLSLFRKKSLERVSSPEQLNSYIRISGSGVWLVLAALLVLLVGLLAWGALGTLETVHPAVAVVENGRATVYTAAAAPAPEAGMTLRLGEVETTLQTAQTAQAEVPQTLDAAALAAANLAPGALCYTAAAPADAPDGVYAAQLVVERITPLSFLLG